jgi:hypothetical protein
MSAEKVALTRPQLYEKVWTTPMLRLAREFGLSDVGLAKLCRRHQIPLPGRGYWARIQFGQKPQRTVLPTLTDLRLDTIEIYRRQSQEIENREPKEELLIPRIEIVPDRLVAHPVARRIEKSITRAKKDEQGRLLAREGRIVPVKVSESALPRVLRILDALFSAADEVSYQLEWPKPYNTKLTVLVLEEKLTLSVTEAIDRREHKPTREETARQETSGWWRPPRWDYTPNGLLRFTLESCEYSDLRRTWKDGKRRKLEDCVGEIFVEFEMTGKAVKRERERRAEAERLYAEQRKRDAEAAARKAEYNRKADAARKLTQAWTESKLMKEFSVELQAALARTEVPDGVRQDLETMIEWTSHHADSLDPLTDLKWLIRTFNNPFGLYGY